jgi:hypothetical protein
MGIEQLLLDESGPRMNIRLPDGAIVADNEIAKESLVVALLSWWRTDGRLEVGGTVWKGGYSEGVTGLGETTFAIDSAQLDTPDGRIAVARQIISVAA